MEIQAVFIISVCTISVMALLIATFASRKITRIEERIDRKSKRLVILEKSVAQLVEEMKKD